MNRTTASPPHVGARRRAAPAAPAASPSDVAAGSAARALLDARRAVSRELRLSEREAEQRLGVRPAPLYALRQLAEHPAHSVAELAARTHTDPSSASVVVQRLVEQGLVARTPAADDRRRTELSAAAAGRAPLRRAPESVHDRVVRAAARLGVPAAHALAEQVTALARALARDGRAGEGGGDAAGAAH